MVWNNVTWGGKPEARSLCCNTKSLICRLVLSYFLVSFYCLTLFLASEISAAFKISCNVDSVFDLVLFVLNVFAIQAEENGVWKTVSLNISVIAHCCYEFRTYFFLFGILLILVQSIRKNRT